jgi:Helix-turn-helix family
MNAQDAADARRLWVSLESIHCVTYFAPPALRAFTELGLRGFWRGYFAGRSAPFGAAGPELVGATFYNFAPSMVARALPDVWTRATSAATLDARMAGAIASLTEYVPAEVPVEAAARCADLLWRPLPSLDPGGRPLGAANLGLGRPDDPLGALWLAATIWREYRGDGHVAVLTAEGVGGLHAHALRDARDGSRKVIQPFRGWTDDEWDAAVADLRERGLVEAFGGLTDAGARLSTYVEKRTDTLAAGLVAGLSPAERSDLDATLRPLATVLAARGIPYPNPAGAPSPAEPGSGA